MKIDYKHFKNFWKKQQENAVHMKPEMVIEHIYKFIGNHNTCAFASGFGKYIRNTPIEYTFMDDDFYFFTEGGDKFKGLEKNKNVCLTIYDSYGGINDSHGLQVMGKATVYPPNSTMVKKVLAFKGIPYDIVKSSEVDVALIKVSAKCYEMYDTDFVKQGYDVRQYYYY